GFVGRAVVTPLHGSDWRINLGVHGSYVDRPADTAGPGTNGVIPVSGFGVRLRDTPELRVDGTQFIDTGTIPAKSASTVGVEGAAQKANIFVQGEYESINVSRSDKISSPTFSGWYVEGSWLLTGESRLYNPSEAAFDGPVVSHPFSLSNGGLGAWELVGRYSDTDLNFDSGSLGSAPKADAIRGGEQQVWSVGVNWYLNQTVRLMLDVDQVHINRLSPSASAYSTPAGAQIGQNFTAVAIRTQAAF
ncbi:MAG TPA: porin, partial [Caulobacteraceae bacterium]|nr:porin [Caulobacteraceae bacterium]